VSEGQSQESQRSPEAQPQELSAEPGQSARADADRPAAAEPTGVDLARVALRAAKEQARARGAVAQQKRDVRRGSGPRSGAGRDGRDPLPLGAAVRGLMTERGWDVPAAVGGVMGRWPQLVGPEVAQHCEPVRFDEEERALSVLCDSTAWATQLRLLAPKLVARLNEDLGQGTVALLKVRGPEAPGARGGRLRAPGSKGPGDTYG
jgi:predicted nucleic acid-binding Zn ribbon protein